MKILVITRRKAERDWLRQEQLIQRAMEEFDRAEAAIVQESRERNARRKRLMAAIWAAHDAGTLPYELDSLLLNEWADDRPA